MHEHWTKQLSGLDKLLSGIETKPNARLALPQRAGLFEVNISANIISLPQGQSYTERLISKIRLVVYIINAAFWLVELLLGYML